MFFNLFKFYLCDLLNFRKAAQLLKPMGKYLFEDMKLSKESGNGLDM